MNLLLGPVREQLWGLLPVHSMGWTAPTRAEFSRLDGSDAFVTEDVDDLRALARFGRRGSRRWMLKRGPGWKLRLTDVDRSRIHYLHGDSIGDFPGGRSQMIFVPSRRGFQAWLESLAARHGKAP